MYITGVGRVADSKETTMRKTTKCERCDEAAEYVTANGSKVCVMCLRGDETAGKRAIRGGMADPRRMAARAISAIENERGA